MSPLKKLSLIVGILLFSISTCSAQVIENSTQDIPALHYYMLSFEAKKNVIIHYKIQVKSGPNVNVYLLDEANYDKYKNTSAYDEAIKEHRSIKEVEEEVTLREAGKYYLIVENPSTTEDARVYVFLEGRSTLPIIIISTVIILVAIVAIIVIMRKRK